MKTLAISFLAAIAASSVWAIPGTLHPESGSPVRGDIKWKSASKVYVVSAKKGNTMVDSEFKPSEVASLSIEKPNGLDKAIEMVENGQGVQATAILTKIVSEYKMLVWDKPAARYLVQAYLAANNAQKAYEVAQGVLADDKTGAYLGEFAPSYWQVLLRLGKNQQLESCLKKAATSGDRASSAEALNMRGDMIRADGGDTPDTYTKALTDAYLRVALMYLDEPCREARFNALQKAAQCFDKLGQATRAEDMRARAKSM